MFVLLHISLSLHCRLVYQHYHHHIRLKADWIPVVFPSWVTWSGNSPRCGVINKKTFLFYKVSVSYARSICNAGIFLHFTQRIRHFGKYIAWGLMLIMQWTLIVHSESKLSPSGSKTKDFTKWEWVVFLLSKLLKKFTVNSQRRIFCNWMSTENLPIWYVTE